MVAFLGQVVAFLGEVVAFLGDLVAFLGELGERQEASPVGAEQPELSLRAVESNSQERADPPVHLGDRHELLILTLPAIELEGVGIVEIILVDAILPVELEFLHHLLGSIPRREDLEDDLGGDAAFFPLLVGTAVTLGPAEDHHRVGGRADLRFALDRIPEQVARHEHVGPVVEDPIEPLLDGHDPLELERVLGHGLPVTIRINDLGLRGGREIETLMEGPSADHPVETKLDSPPPSVSLTNFLEPGQSPFTRP